MVAFAQVAHVNTMACLLHVLHCAHAQIFAVNLWIYNHILDLGSRTLGEQLEDQKASQTINPLYQWMCSHHNKKFKQFNISFPQLVLDIYQMPTCFFFLVFLF